MISKYKQEDIKEINVLGKEVNPNFERLFKVASLPANEQIYVCKNNDELLGFLHVLMNIEQIEILNLVVSEKHRKKGIASLLIDYLLSEPNLDYQRIILEVSASNIAAINLYHKFNFHCINQRKKYYGNDDALVMERRK